jgi:hypothetical protein
MISACELFSLKVISEEEGICTVSSFDGVFKVPKYALENAYPKPYEGQNLIQDFEWWQLAHEIP